MNVTIDALHFPKGADGVHLSRDEAEVLYQALTQCEIFFQHRDIMNAAGHCDATRYSPITMEVQEAKEMLKNVCRGEGPVELTRGR